MILIKTAMKVTERMRSGRRRIQETRIKCTAGNDIETDWLMCRNGADTQPLQLLYPLNPVTPQSLTELCLHSHIIYTFSSSHLDFQFCAFSSMVYVHQNVRSPFLSASSSSLAWRSFASNRSKAFRLAMTVRAFRSPPFFFFPRLCSRKGSKSLTNLCFHRSIYFLVDTSMPISFISLELVAKNLSKLPSNESKCSLQLRPISLKNVSRSWTFSFVLVDVFVLNTGAEYVNVLTKRGARITGVKQDRSTGNIKS